MFPNLAEISVSLSAVTIIGSFAAVAGYFLMRGKFLKELEVGKRKEEELARRAYETTVLKEIGDRIGYSLDGAKIVEIISGSLGELLPYSTVSYMILAKNSDKVRFECTVHESVSSDFIEEIKHKLFAAISEMNQEPMINADIDESVSGTILAENDTRPVQSFFNLPIVISGRLIGIINVASVTANLYNDVNTEVLYKIARHASDAVSKLQEVLENEKSRLLQAVQSLADGLLMVDTNYHLVLVNRKLSSLLGTPPEPTIFDIVNALSGQLDLRTKMEEAFSTEGELPTQDVTVKGKVLQVLASKVLDKKTQKPMGVVVLFNDITDAKSLEALRRDFTSMMVHELRAPLTSIKSTVELMQGDIPKLTPPDLDKYLTTINSSSVNMLELVNDLLDVAKMEAGKFDVIAERADLVPVVVERVESFKPLAEEKHLKLATHVEGDIPEGYFDKVRIKQVLNNLLSNAIKYSDSGDITVKVSLEKVNGHTIDIQVSVADTGIGIDQAGIESLFSKFGQLTSGRNKAGLKSSGLGLFIAKGIVEAWGGKIWARSDGVGLGSTFYFTVPLADVVEKKESSARGSKLEVSGFTNSKVAHA